MKIIEQNPFRILGVYSNATTKELMANSNKIMKFASTGGNVNFPNDGIISKRISRSQTDVDNAKKQINLPKDKLKYALFWFVNNNAIDDTALTHLAAGEAEYALEKFGYRINFSSLINKGVLSFILNDKKNAVNLITKVIHTETYRNEFVKCICCDTFSISEDDLAKMFIDTLLEEYASSTVLTMFGGCQCPSDISYIKGKSIGEPIARITDEINKTRNLSNASSVAYYQAGLNLINNTKSDLALVKRLTSANDIQCQKISDALASAIMHCSVEFFNNSNHSASDIDKALELNKVAKDIAIGSYTKDKCSDGINTLTEMKQKSAIEADLEAIATELVSFKSKTDSIGNARSLVDNCKPHLVKIKNALGASDDLYEQLSSAVAGNALGMVIEVINSKQKICTASELRPYVYDALAVMDSMSNMYMDYSLSNRYDQNKTILQSIAMSLTARFTPQPTPYSSSRSSSSGGCYIATMVYGDYDHPQVMVLRDFRDTVLQHHVLGRAFIKFYYRYSPTWVEKLKDKKGVNRVIKKILDKFIKWYSNEKD
ncbi:MAG: hypothetical protein IKK36_13465 [Bacteroidales bacterium]|nr:hypothetical protein [Bacteroidales bacterium]MBR3946559.1 hypothetical protein [Bacteroidales bacterium]